MTKKDLGLFYKQVLNQYEKEIKTKYKKDLDFSPFIKDMNNMSHERYNELNEYILEKSIKEIHDFLKKKIFSVEELVLFYLKRIKEYNKDLNALIELNPDALIIAREIDEKGFKDEDDSLLKGIPIILKDNIGTKDKMHNTAGALVLKDSKVKEDSPVVSRIKENQAIILGKANLSEWAFYMSSRGVCGYSTLGGQTKNPYGKFDVGGSSSGSAVSAATNLAAATLGTETCGSIIYPSSQNSVVGLKPTIGLWESKSIVPIAPSFDTPGPITKNVADTALLMNYLTKKKELEKEDYLESLNVKNKNYKIGIISNKEIKPYLRDEDKVIMNKAIDDMKKIGFEVDYIEINKDAFNVDMESILEYEFNISIAKYLTEDAEADFPKNLVDIWEFNNEDINNRAPHNQDLIQKSAFNKVSKETYEKILNRDKAICEKAMSDKLKEFDALVTLSNYFSLIYAYGGYPALSVPGGFRSSGEPVGITFICAPYEEKKLLNIGYIYEQNTKHRKSPK